MRIKRSLTTGLAAAAGTAAVLALAAPAQAAEVIILVDRDQIPTTAEEFGTHSCEGLTEPSDDHDYWIFRLPAEAEAEGGFIDITATYADATGSERTRTMGVHGGVLGADSAYVTAPTGWTLLDADALVEDPAEGATFDLDRTCLGAPTEEPSATEEPTSPSEEPSTSGEESPSAGESSSPTGPILPVTGLPLGTAFVTAAALAAAGAALLLILRRRESQES
ncbi:hypothetical protein SAMN05216298_2498 [Glycomyces sambucus]|uniref:LPXTG-motif cell wall anchor domain-containing protein n=1 Tax=Glycomyces sambucus TaxID=380244 RepID=A0A1G9GXX8_9ACTN|nr:hypothetical protein [Glycomyces sambucus]SDL05548.1 hypothetical protein SAMN05216298_2498 [Glycomyces sambucus]